MTAPLIYLRWVSGARLLPEGTDAETFDGSIVLVEGAPPPDAPALAALVGAIPAAVLRVTPDLTAVLSEVTSAGGEPRFTLAEDPPTGLGGRIDAATARTLIDDLTTAPQEPGTVEILPGPPLRLSKRLDQVRPEHLKVDRRAELFPSIGVSLVFLSVRSP